MSDNIDPRSVNVSVKIYERLLATYPAAFRREYAQAMKQLFRDQCRDAWSEAGSRGLTLLWIRVLADWAKTSVVEHLSNLNERKFSFLKALRAINADPRFRAPFFRVFAAVFIPAIVCSLLIALWSPRIYSSTVRIEVQQSAPPYAPPGNSIANTDPYFVTTQMKIMESYHILTNVIADLDLSEKLPDQLGKPRWTTEETYMCLSKMIHAERLRSTHLIEINVKNHSPQLAANIANDISHAYRIDMEKQWHELHWFPDGHDFPSKSIIVRDPARAEPKPIYPNPRVVVIWILEGTLLAVAAGGIAAWFGMISRDPRQRGSVLTPPL